MSPRQLQFKYDVKPMHGKEDTAPPDHLLLDDENPRLASGIGAEHLTQPEIRKRLWVEMAVDEVAFSIAANGYYSDERLLVVPSRRPGYFVVVEGNRRLAAVQLLLDSGMRHDLGATDLPTVTPAVKKSLERLPITIYRDRKSLWAYLGFRHINGVKAWDAYSKAQYVANVRDTYDVDLREIADRIGDRHSTVTRLYRGLKVLRQAEQQAGFDVEDRVRGRFYFSHLYTAMDQPDFQRFLGITSESSLKSNPVPKSRVSELRELMTWLYGRKSSNTPPVVQTQYPDLNNLRLVISNRAGLSALRSGLPLATAIEISVGDDRRFREAITRAAEEMRRAKGTVTTGYEGDVDLLETIHQIEVLVSSVRAEMEGIRSSRKRNRAK